MDVDDSFGKGARSFLRQIVLDAALDDPVRISAREFLGIGIAVRVWRTICITFKGNGGHGDDRHWSSALGGNGGLGLAGDWVPREEDQPSAELTHAGSPHLLCHASQRPIHFFTVGVSRVRL